MAAWSSATARPRTPLQTRAWLRTLGRPGPESWVWPVASAGVVVLAWGSLEWYPLGTLAEGGHHHQEMSGGHRDPEPLGQLPAHVALWGAMVAATMLPLVARNLRSVGLRSPRARRTRATVEAASGWALVWMAFGLVLTVSLAMTRPMVPAAWTTAAIAVAAIAWQFTSVKQIAVARCHRRFAPPLGAAATPACLSFGRSLGRDCLVSCWPAMAMMAVAGHQLLAVAALGWLSWRDRRRPHDRPGRLVSVLVLAGVGAYALLVRA